MVRLDLNGVRFKTLFRCQPFPNLSPAAKTHHMFHSCPVSAVACHPDNTLVATGGAEGNVKIVNTKTGAVITSFEDHTDNIESLAFSTSAPVLLASASLDGTVRVFDVTRHTTLHTCKHDVSLAGHAGRHSQSAVLCSLPHVATFVRPGPAGCRGFCEMAPHSSGVILVLPGRDHSGVGRA
jgi:WD40 repeat protein